MVDGQEGTEEVIAAELMPVLPVNKIFTTDVKRYISIKASGKFSFLFVNIKNTSNASMYFISRSDGKDLYQIFYITGKKLDDFYLHNKYLVVFNNSSWSDFTVIPFIGKIDSVEVIDSIPQDSTKLTVL